MNLLAQLKAMSPAELDELEKAIRQLRAGHSEQKATLTPRQQEVYDWLRAYFLEHGYAPTVREMSDHFGWGGPSAASNYLNLFARKGLIRRGTANCARAFTLTGEMR